MPVFKKTPAARYGYMPPECGRIWSKEKPAEPSTPEPGTPPSTRELSPELRGKVEDLFSKMDYNHDGTVTRDEAKRFFKKFANVSVNAMFNEVDEDHNEFIEHDEFVRFWEQVKNSGYSEEDLLFELDELLQGNVWVDYADSRDVGA